MTDEAKALVAHFRAIAEWLDPEIDMIEEQDVLQAADLIETQAREIERLRQTGTFLLARLDDLEWLDDQLEETARQYFGHVDPAIYHFRAALAGDSHD